MSEHVLTILTFLPLAGAVLILSLRKEGLTRWIALATTAAVFAVCVPLYSQFDTTTSALQFVESAEWIPAWNITYGMGVDGISFPFLLLASLLSILCVSVSWTAVTKRTSEFYAALLVTETAMLGLFSATNLFCFFVFWELLLVPMFLLIGIWGGPKRVYSAVKFLLFTLAGSVLMLVGMIVLYNGAGTLDFRELADAGVAALNSAYADAQLAGPVVAHREYRAVALEDKAVLIDSGPLVAGITIDHFHG